MRGNLDPLLTASSCLVTTCGEPPRVVCVHHLFTPKEPSKIIMLWPPKPSYFVVSLLVTVVYVTVAFNNAVPMQQSFLLHDAAVQSVSNNNLSATRRHTRIKQQLLINNKISSYHDVKTSTLHSFYHQQRTTATASMVKIITKAKMMARQTAAKITASMVDYAGAKLSPPNTFYIHLSISIQ